ncbi:MAG: hypothetical protein L0241_19170 [Planctomycetia bacterium]|nr:hypothetical protein [Planctomycetia bacterium]
MSHEHESSEAGTSPTTAEVPAEPSRTEEMLERAKRILAGDIRPEDYLPVTPELMHDLDEYCKHLETESGIVATAEARQRMLNDWTLQFHHGGTNVLARYTDRGVLVLAAGNDQIGKVRQHLNPDYRHGFALMFPTDA